MLMTKKEIKPIIKWAGGKRQLLKEIRKHTPDEFNCYYEPFFGGGAVFFDIQPPVAFINDSNLELVNMYEVIKNEPLALIEELKKHVNEKKYFYEIRGLDRMDSYKKLSDVQRAARLIFLNKTCYNGLYRVNSKGYFNTPYGNYKNPNIVDIPNILRISEYFNESDITIKSGDFSDSLFGVKSGDFVYLDPPYDPINESSSFTSYTFSGFSRNEQERLKLLCDKLTNYGVKFLLSNSATDFIIDLYKEYNLTYVKATRAINSVASGRTPIDEVLVKNY
jgi:DNA adenine methylase